MRLDFKPFITIRVIISTAIVFLGAIVLFRLGLWQISRYYERQAFNNQYLTQQNESILDLNKHGLTDLDGLEYRRITIRGIYDHEHAIARVNQYRDGLLGYGLMTPLRMVDGSAIYIDRGWVPAINGSDEPDWSEYEMDGTIEINGILRKAVDLNGKNDPNRPHLWLDFYPASLQMSLPYPIAEEFIQPIPNGEQTPPIPEIKSVQITEGPHLSYASQWFTFGIMLLLGYPFVLRKSLNRQRK